MISCQKYKNTRKWNLKPVVKLKCSENAVVKTSSVQLMLSWTLKCFNVVHLRHNSWISKDVVYKQIVSISHEIEKVLCIFCSQMIIFFCLKLTEIFWLWHNKMSPIKCYTTSQSHTHVLLKFHIIKSKWWWPYHHRNPFITASGCFCN